MKRVISAVLGFVSVLFGILCMLSVLYLFGEGVGRGYTLNNMDKLVISAYALLALGSSFLSTWLFKRSSKRQNSL